MKHVQPIDSIRDYSVLLGQPTRHPMVAVIDFAKTTLKPQGWHPDALSFGFYAIFLKNDRSCTMRYGRNDYDYQEGTLVFIAPGQVFSLETIPPDYQPSSLALLFHPDLIRGTSLGQAMKAYTFFSYEAHEALHLSDLERGVILDCFREIDLELQHAIDTHSKKLLISNIELFLNYCVRFYERQFMTRNHVKGSVVERFEALLIEYFHSNKPLDLGIPLVPYFAQQLHFSPNYFSDLIKKETGKTALEHIHAKLVEEAKTKLFHPEKSVSEVAYELGFKYPQHFTRFFKQHVGQSPSNYRTVS